MGDDLYFTRLRWHAGRGIAKLHGRVVVLERAPVLAGIAVHECDYAPEISLRIVQRRACDPRDDMTPTEIADADKMLRCYATPVV